MTINTINSANTFLQWWTTTNQIVNEVNELRDGQYTKSSGILNITAPGNSFMTNGSMFYGKTQFNGNVLVNRPIVASNGYTFADGTTQTTASMPT